MVNKEYVSIPDEFYEKRRQSIEQVIGYLRKRGFKLKGVGIDVGPFVGTSVEALANMGLSVTHVERDSRYVETLRRRDVDVVEADIFDYLDCCADNLNFLTFFGAPGHLSIRHLVEKASLKLTANGVIIVTGPENIESSVNAALNNVGGRKFKPKRVHAWDKIVYAYKK